MLAQQACATMGRSAVPLIAPAIVAGLGISDALVGVYLSITSLAGFVTTLACGGFILRYGAMRMTQVGMLGLGSGLALAASGILAAFVPAAFTTGMGSAVSTPSSSHLLGRFAPPRLAPLVFSIKQTGVPAGLMVGGLLGPALTESLGWQGALLCLGAMCAAVALVLQPLRRRFDDDRDPAQKLSPADIGRTVRAVLADPALRVMCFTMFSFVGLQSLFTGFLVLFLVRGLGHDLAAAGAIFSTAVAVAVPARILWGWLASRLFSPARLLAFLGVAMAGSAVTTALIGSDWPLWLTGAATVAFSATAVSWHGVLLAEVARLSPPGRIGATTGGVLAFGDAGSLLLPLAFSGALALTDSYRPGFLIGAVPAFAVAFYMLAAGPARKPVS